MNCFISKQLRHNCKNFIDFKENHYCLGWGRKPSGLKAIKLAKKHNTSFRLLEDGFIRSVGLGEDDSFSIVEDDIGIYYDANVPSRLENILNYHSFSEDEIFLAKQAIGLIIDKKISKYNTGDLSLPSYLKEDDNKKVLIVAQTKGDMSLKYGRAYEFDEKQMIEDAIKENPTSKIYLKIHPDVLAGKKESSIDIEFAKKHCIVISENINPIVLLEVFDKVYTQTSQMGFEALLLDKEVITYGVPFYSNWGLTNDKLICDRRERKLSLLEVFAGAYILYTKYYNPYRKRASDIIDTILEITLQKDKQKNDNIYDYLCIGDSHIRVFESKVFNLLPYSFDVCYVAGATAYGVENINSKTRAYYKFKASLDKRNYKNIIVTLGEVDTSYTLWNISLKSDIDIYTLLDKSIDRYKNFLLFLRQYGKVYVIDSPLPTVKNDALCDDTISGIRKSTNVDFYNKIKLNMLFNSKIKEWIRQEKDIFAIDSNRFIYRDGVKTIFLPRDRCNHHYNKFTFALLLFYFFIKGKFNE